MKKKVLSLVLALVLLLAAVPMAGFAEGRDHSCPGGYPCHQCVKAPEAITGLEYNGTLQKLVKPGAVKTRFWHMEYSLDGENWSRHIPKVKDAGAYNVYYAAVDFWGYKYIEAGWVVPVTIAPKAVMIKAEPAFKYVFDEDPALPVTIDGLVEGDTVEYSVYRTGSECVGKYDIIVEAEPDQDNYTVETEGLVEGFEIKEKEGFVLVDAEGYFGKYNGEAHGPAVSTTTCPEAEVDITVEYSYKEGRWSEWFADDSECLLEGWSEWSTEAPALTDKGFYTVVVKATAEGYFTGYDFCFLEVVPRLVVMTSADAEKVYDGKALTCDEMTVEGDGFLSQEDVSWTFTGSQTEVGSSENTFEVVFGEGANEDNYCISKEFGTLTVTEAETPVKPEDPNNNVKTGITSDSTSVYLVIGTLLVMAAAAAFVTIKKRRAE